jgi:hypothetical protein
MLVDASMNVSSHGPTATPMSRSNPTHLLARHYAAVWTRDGPAAWQTRHGLTAEQYQQTLEDCCPRVAG